MREYLIESIRMAGAQSLQHTIWPHGRNAMDASKSRQTLQRRWSFNCLFSSRRDSVSEHYLEKKYRILQQNTIERWTRGIDDHKYWREE
jgi:hypothetical protein